MTGPEPYGSSRSKSNAGFVRETKFYLCVGRVLSGLGLPELD